MPPPPRNPREPQRIAKLLARAGIASRREIERMIEEGRVAIDGKPVEKPATLLSSLSGVTVDGVPVKAPAPARLFLFHKPAGLLTTERDPKGRPTIYDRLPKDLPRVMPVGRLDMNTEGLLLLTTDGELKRQLELPSSGVERIYRARAFGEVSQDQLEELIHGVEIEGIRYGSIDANLERRTGRNTWIEMRLTEGKNREVRRVLEHLGLQVSRLIRVAYGPFALGDLPVGAVDEVRQHDLVVFRKNPRNQASGQERDQAARPSRPARPPRRPEGDQARPAARPARPPRSTPQRQDASTARPSRAGGGPRGRAPDEAARAKPGKPRQRREAGSPAPAGRPEGPARSTAARPQQPRRGPRSGASPTGSPRPQKPTSSPRGRRK